MAQCTRCMGRPSACTAQVSPSTAGALLQPWTGPVPAAPRAEAAHSLARAWPASLHGGAIPPACEWAPNATIHVPAARRPTRARAKPPTSQHPAMPCTCLCHCGVRQGPPGAGERSSSTWVAPAAWRTRGAASIATSAHPSMLLPLGPLGLLGASPTTLPAVAPGVLPSPSRCGAAPPSARWPRGFSEPS